MTFEEEVSRALGRIEANQTAVLDKVVDFGVALEKHVEKDEKRFQALFTLETKIKTLAKVATVIAAGVVSVAGFVGLPQLMDWLSGSSK